MTSYLSAGTNLMNGLVGRWQSFMSGVLQKAMVFVELFMK